MGYTQENTELSSLSGSVNKPAGPRLVFGEVNDAYPRLVDEVQTLGSETHPRGTTCLEIGPVLWNVTNPLKNVVTSHGRPINLTFALAEVLWILQGRNDVEMLQFYNSQIGQFSDDGEIFNAAYGYRLGYAHGYDQMFDVVKTLTDDRDSRRATMCIWHPDDKGNDRLGFPRKTKDRACNLISHLMIRDGKLDWLQVIRSNDIILGMPYNLIQWTMMQSSIAARVGVPVGEFNYLADSLHIYKDTYYDSDAVNVTKFDLYHYFRDFGAPDPDWSDLEWLVRVEEDVREGVQIEPATFLGRSIWAKSVAYLLMAHRAYKEQKDDIAFSLLISAHPIYCYAQMRFYFKHRWYRMENVKKIIRSVYLVEELERWVMGG